MVVLILGSHDDPVIRFFLRSIHGDAHREGYICVAPQEIRTTVHINKNGWSFSSGRQIAHSAIHGVWNRIWCDVSRNMNQSHDAVMAYVYQLLNKEYPKVVNRPQAALSNFSKCYQLGIIAANYLRPAPGLILKGQYLSADEQSIQWIVKSASSVRSKVVSLGYFSEPVRTFHRSLEPVLCQPRIHGDVIRVHVLVDKVWSCLCRSTQIDYRFDRQTQQEEIQLPVGIIEDCCRITQDLDLAFSGIDIIRDKGTYTLLEVNTAPGYNYFHTHSVHVSAALNSYWHQ